MNRALVLLVALTLAGCGGSSPDRGDDFGVGGGGGGGGVGGGGGGSGGGDGSGSGGGGLDGGVALDGSVAGDGGVVAGKGAWYTRTFKGGADGSRVYHVYVPPGYTGSAAPLVMVLHGCTQSGLDAAAMSGYPAIADADPALLVFPDQDAAANSSLCWNWFLDADLARGHGEPALLDGVAGAVAAEWSVDAKRVFVMGPSAGGAMAVILAATYPDRFASISVIAGCEYGGFPCGQTGGPDPAQQGKKAYQAMGSRARLVPVQIFHGDADPLVPAVNGDQIAQQWLATDDWADNGALDGSAASATATHASGQVPGGHSYDIDRYLAPSSAVVVERWLIHGGGHAWPGGVSSASFSDPAGPNATAASWAFFKAHPRP